MILSEWNRNIDIDCRTYFLPFDSAGANNRENQKIIDAAMSLDVVFTNLIIE
jgi:hypothetical protein